MNFSWTWIRRHKWRLLLFGIVSLLLISPIPDIYDRQDNVISPLISVIFLAIICGTAERKATIFLLGAFTLVWVMISVVTEGSGIFTGLSLLAPLLFMFLLVSIFVLLARWLVRVVHIDTEVLCAAVCGYLLLGILWAGFYAFAGYVVMHVRPNAPSAFTSSTETRIGFADLLYFSYTTLTTTGFGDIIPRAPEIRMLAVMEAIVGVFYNTIVIARFVGLYGLKVKDRESLMKDERVLPQ